MSAQAYESPIEPFANEALHFNWDVNRVWQNVAKPQYDKNAQGQIEMTKTPWESRNETLTRVHGKAADAYVLSPDEITSIRTQIMEVLRWKAKSQFCIDSVDIGPGMLTAEYYSGNDVTKPRMTRTFRGGYNVEATKSKSTVELYGMDYDISIDKVSLDAGNSTQNKVHLQPSLQAFETNTLIKSLIQYREWYIFRGTSIPNFTDLGIKGLCNWTGVTNPGALGLGADDILNAAGDVDDAAVQMANALINAKFEPPFELHMTPLVYGRALRNKHATSGIRDMKFIMDMVDPASGVKLFSSVQLNPYLIASATETSTTGAMLCMKKLPTTENYVAEPYALGVYPLQTGSLGWDAKVLWMGGTVLQRPTAIAYRGTLQST
jgi:hypothetical protein